MAKPPALAPESNFPDEAYKRTKQEFPDALAGAGGNFVFTWNIASAADAITPWGRNVRVRDRQLRDFWPTETYLAGAVSNVGFRNATFDWELRGPDKVVAAATDMLNAAMAGDQFGWAPYMLKWSADLYTQDNGAFTELIRDPGMDANSQFKEERAPVLGINHLDSNQCIRTGNPEIPVLYTDLKGQQHKMKWYQIISYSDYPSPIENMHGVGYCSVTRALRVAQIMRSVLLFKDEKISGRHYKQIHFVSGVSRQDIKDEMTRGQEEANNSGLLRFIMPAILASLDPEKPVSTASIDLASLPDGFDFDQEMRWYISGLALAFGVDYQEFAPLPGGNIGSSAQSMILHRKQSGKGPGVVMRTISESFKNYGVLPRGVDMRFNDKDEQEELEKQEVRTKAIEEAAIAINSGLLSPEKAAQSLVRRGIYETEEIEGLEQYWKDMMEAKKANPSKQTVGDRGGNTIVEDAGRQETGKPNLTVGDRLLKKERDEENDFRMWDALKLAFNVARGQRPQVTIVKENAKPPVVNVDVHNHPGKSPVVNVTNEMKAQKAPNVTVNVPQQKPPIVNVEAPRVEVKNTVNVPKQETPVVNVAAPNVQVNMPARKGTKIKYKAGKPIGLEPEE